MTNMSNETAGGTVSRLLLGRRLRQLRGRKRMAAAEVASATGLARATVWRMERGDNRCRYRAGLEGYARHQRHYQGALVPELLQTEMYARTLLLSVRGATNLQVHKHTQVRMNRQTVMTRRRTEASLEFLLDESVLHRTVGGPSIMAAQLRRILDRGLLPHVSIRIVPGVHSGLRAGAFSVLDFPVDPRLGELPSAVWLERAGEQLFLDGYENVAEYEERWNDICSHALDEGASRELVEEVLGGY